MHKLILTQYVADAFTDKVFKGNPAAVCILEEWLPDGLMQDIAKGNNLSESAFAVKKREGTSCAGSLQAGKRTYAAMLLWPPLLFL